MKPIVTICILLLAFAAPGAFAQTTASLRVEQEFVDGVNKAGIQEANQEVLKRFDTLRLKTRTFKPRGISLESASDVVGAELHNFELQEHNGEYRIVDTFREKNRGVEVKHLTETCVLDAKSNALIVTALPATLNQIEGVLDRIEQEVSSSSASSTALKPVQIEAILLRSGDGKTPANLPPSITARDLESLGIKSVTEVGRAVVTLAAEKTDLGRAKARLGKSYGVELAYQDYRQPYLVLRGSLLPDAGTDAMEQEILTIAVGTEHTFDAGDFKLTRINVDASGKNPTAEMIVDLPGGPDNARILLREREFQMINKFGIMAMEIIPKGGIDGFVRLHLFHGMVGFPAGLNQPGAPVNGQDEQTLLLKRGEEREFRVAKFRLIRVEKNDAQDNNDDAAEFQVNVPGLGPQSVTLQEFQTQAIGNFEISAEDVQPANKAAGDGQARLRVKYLLSNAQESQQAGRGPLLENTVFLEPGKPALLGLTNMREALILVLNWKK